MKTILPLLLLALMVRLPTLARRAVVEGDGVHYATLARAAAAGDWRGVSNPYWSNLWPGLMALTSRLTGVDVVTAGRALSLLAGLALVPVTLILGAHLFDDATGRVAGALVAVHPDLAHFSTLVFTESIFTLLLMAYLLASWYTTQTGKIRAGLVAGVLAGLSIATRPEATAVILASWPWLYIQLRRGHGARKAVDVLMVVLALTLASIALRSTLVAHYYGRSDLGFMNKGVANIWIGLAADDGERERLSHEVIADGRSRLEAQANLGALAAWLRAHPLALARHIALNSLRVLRTGSLAWPPVPTSLIDTTPLTTLPGGLSAGASVTLFAVAMLGLRRGLATRATRAATLLLASVTAVYCLGLTITLVHARLVLPLVGVFAILLAHGLVSHSRGARVILSPKAVWAWGALSLTALMVASPLPYAEEPVMQRNAALRLKESFSVEARLMTAAPVIAFYFYDAASQDNAVDLPWLPYPALLERARQAGVAAILAPEWRMTAGFPAASALTPGGDHPGLIYTETIGDTRPYRVHVFIPASP